MVDPTIADEWLTKAQEDFEFARINLEEGRPFFAQICFFFHQAAEKALKAFIVARELEFRKIHDLTMLMKICSSVDREFTALREECEYLNAFYVEARYPVHWPTSFSRVEADAAMGNASAVLELVKRKTQSPD